MYFIQGMAYTPVVEIFVVIILGILSVFVVPVMLDKTTERGTFDFVHPYLREIWTGIIGVYLLGLCWWQRGYVMEQRSNYDSAWGYVVVSLIAVVCACLVWMVTGVALRRSPLKDRLSSALTFRALAVGIRNMPERKNVQMTCDGKPWHEEIFSDVRLNIESTLDFAIQNLDLSILATDGEEHSRIAGIGQLSQVSGLEFHPPKMPELPPIALLGTDGKTYQLPTDNMFGSTWLPATKFRVFCPRLFPGEPLRLIIATLHDDGIKVPPQHLRIIGTFETPPSDGSTKGNVDAIVKVRQ
jgi:hypothetical protein